MKLSVHLQRPYDSTRSLFKMMIHVTQSFDLPPPSPYPSSPPYPPPPQFLLPLSVRYSSLPDYVVKGIWRTIRQRVPFCLFCARPSSADLAWAGMSTPWRSPRYIHFNVYGGDDPIAISILMHLVMTVLPQLFGTSFPAGISPLM